MKAKQTVLIMIILAALTHTQSNDSKFSSAHILKLTVSSNMTFFKSDNASLSVDKSNHEDPRISISLTFSGSEVTQGQYLSELLGIINVISNGRFYSFAISFSMRNLSNIRISNDTEDSIIMFTLFQNQSNFEFMILVDNNSETIQSFINLFAIESNSESGSSSSSSSN